MIKVEAALEVLKQNIKPLNRVVKKYILEALNYSLAEDVLSPINMPPFAQSAMDGYAINSMNNESSYVLIEEVKAGDDKQVVLKPGEAIRIFTGAAVPETANAVIMQEKVVLRGNNKIEILDTITNLKNIRPKGEQVKKEEIALKKESVLNAAAIAYLATLGITEVLVFDKPKIGIIVTGNELVNPGNELKFGQIYESNSIMLKAALLQNNFDNISIEQVRDDYSQTKYIINKALAKYDVVLLTGGISVGDYDFVGKALKELKVKEQFYKIKQKPGKPMYYGTFKETNVFALPGNPAAALTCFYIYVLNSLCKLAYLADKLNKTTKNITADYKVKGDRALFLKAEIKNDEVSVLESQSSAMLNTFALSNALIYIPIGVEEYKKGSPVNVYKIL